MPGVPYSTHILSFIYIRGRLEAIKCLLNLPDESDSTIFHSEFRPLKHLPKAIVSVTSDLITDQRVNRNCMALMDQGFEVTLVGRDLKKDFSELNRPYHTRRFKLLFNKGPFFYAEYNIRLFLFLLFHKADLLFANDLDTLPANFFAGWFKGIRPVYDSHEYYTGVPELESRPLVKGIWKRFEKFIFPKLQTIITVNDSIALIYENEYGKKLIVLRNVPVKPYLEFANLSKSELRQKLELPLNKKILILQGAGINVERGAEEALEAMRYTENCMLIILGGGDVMENLKAIVDRYNLQEKVKFIPRKPYLEMMQYTMASDLGLSFDKDTNVNYRYSLPNKIFDYIHAGIPVLASKLKEVEKIISKYQIGDFIPNHDPVKIAAKINTIFADSNTFEKWLQNLTVAANELNWANEVKKFPDLKNEL